MSVAETTKLAMMTSARAVRDRDWQDLRAILQWKFRTRRFLLPMLDARRQEGSDPMSMYLASLIGIIKDYPRDEQDLARQLAEKLPGLALEDESRLSEQEWMRMTDDLQRVIRLSEEEEWTNLAVSTLRDLRMERFRLDNPNIPDEDVISYFPLPISAEKEEQLQDSLLARITTESVINKDQLPADIRATTKALDAANADLRSKLSAEIKSESNFRNLPTSFKKRVQENPAFCLLSKQGSAEAGELEFDQTENTLEIKAQLVADSFYLRPPKDFETAMPAFGSSTTLFAMPKVAQTALDASFIATKGTMMVIEVDRSSSFISLEAQATFSSKLIFGFNIPENRDPTHPDLPTPPDRRDQDDFSPLEWDNWSDSFTLTALLARQELDRDDCKDKWFSILRLLKSYRITPIFVFKSSLDFTMFRLSLNIDHWGTPENDLSFAAIVAGNWSESAISRWSQWLNNKSAFDYQRSKPQFSQLRDIISEAFSGGQSRYVTVVNVERTIMTVSALPADFSLETLVFGPWAKEIQARRIWAPSPSDMMVAFNGTTPKIYPTVFFSGQHIPQILLDQIWDKDQIEAALRSLQPTDPNAAEFLAYVWTEASNHFGRGTDETFRVFYNEVRVMLSPVPVHNSEPVPLSSNRPIPIFFKQGQRLNNVTTDSPTFVQAFAWKMNSPIATVQSFLPTMLARILSLQTSLKTDGQIPVSVSPSLHLEIGLNPPEVDSNLDMDWKMWARQERLKLKMLPVWKDFESASKFLPLPMKIQLASHLVSFQLGFQGLWPAQTPEAVKMLELIWSPQAAVQSWTRKWQMSTSPEFAERPAFMDDQPKIFSWMDFETIPLEIRLDTREMIDRFDHWARDSEIDIHTEIFNNFHPILVSRAHVQGRPAVVWPISRIEMNTMAHLTSKTESRMVHTVRIDQSNGPWISVVDRVVVADVVTDNFPTVMLLLENPFAKQFRALEGNDFVRDRQQILRDLFKWPSPSVNMKFEFSEKTC